MRNTCGFIIYNEATNKVLIGHVTGFDEQWSIPKGKQEKGETKLQAAIRETKEESNISKEFISNSVVTELTPQNYHNGKKRLNAFLAITNEIPKDIKCISYFHDSFGNKKPEFDILIWVDIQELVDMVYNIHYTQQKSLVEALEIIKNQ